jgi:hypothetical protein
VARGDACGNKLAVEALKTSRLRRTVIRLVVTLLPVLVATVGLVRLLRAVPRTHAPLPMRSVSPLPEHRDPTAPAEDRTPEVRGRVLDADGNLVRGAAVRLLSSRPPYAVLGGIQSDAAGRFSFAKIRSPRVRVTAQADPGGAVTSAILHANAGQTTEVTLVLSSASAVRGVVVDAADHAVAGATLSIEGVPWSIPSATSGEDGTFRLAIVPDIASFLVAVARGYKTARLALLDRDDPSERVVRLRLEAASPVSGEVHDPDDKPVRARIIACEGQASEARTTSGEDGVFQLPSSTIGCDAIALHDDYAASDPVTLAEGGHALLRLRVGGSIDGTVVDQGGAAVVAFTLGIESFSAAHGRNFRSVAGRAFDDPRGAFHWDKLAPGSYVLVATTKGKPPARSDPVEVLGGAATTGVRIVLAQGGTVVGRIYDERHAPLSDVDLRFDAISSVVASGAVAKSGGAGDYRLEGAPRGPFTLFAHKSGYRARMVSGLRIDSSGTLTEDITLDTMDGGAGLEFGGIGAGLVQTGDGISVNPIFPGDPADRIGLRQGDRIVRIDGEDTDGMSLADALQRIRGEPGTSLGVSVQRAQTGEVVDLLITRGLIVH